MLDLRAVHEEVSEALGFSLSPLITADPTRGIQREYV